MSDYRSTVTYRSPTGARRTQVFKGGKAVSETSKTEKEFKELGSTRKEREATLKQEAIKKSEPIETDEELKGVPKETTSGGVSRRLTRFEREAIRATTAPATSVKTGETIREPIRKKIVKTPTKPTKKVFREGRIELEKVSPEERTRRILEKAEKDTGIIGIGASAGSIVVETATGIKTLGKTFIRRTGEFGRAISKPTIKEKEKALKEFFEEEKTKAVSTVKALKPSSISLGLESSFRERPVKSVFETILFLSGGELGAEKIASSTTKGLKESIGIPTKTVTIKKGTGRIGLLQTDDTAKLALEVVEETIPKGAKVPKPSSTIKRFEVKGLVGGTDDIKGVVGPTKGKGIIKVDKGEVKVLRYVPEKVDDIKPIITDKGSITNLKKEILETKTTSKTIPKNLYDVPKRNVLELKRGFEVTEQGTFVPNMADDFIFIGKGGVVDEVPLLTGPKRSGLVTISDTKTGKVVFFDPKSKSFISLEKAPKIIPESSVVIPETKAVSTSGRLVNTKSEITNLLITKDNILSSLSASKVKPSSEIILGVTETVSKASASTLISASAGTNILLSGRVTSPKTVSSYISRNVPKTTTFPLTITKTSVTTKAKTIPKTTTRSALDLNKYFKKVPKAKVKRKKSFETIYEDDFIPKKKKKKETAFSVFVRRKGQDLLIGRGLRREEALALGAFKTKTTLGARFKIVGTGGKITKGFGGPSFKSVQKEFRGYKIRKGEKTPLKNEFIQKKQFRLGTRKEVKAIQQAKKNKSSSLIKSKGGKQKWI